jgi:toxin YhaV
MNSEYVEWHFSVFASQYNALESRFLFLARKYPDSFHTHEDVKFFKRVRTAMDTCLGCPDAKEYVMGDMLAGQRHGGAFLGKGYGHWRRIKNDMPPRYRLFFVFSSKERTVIYSWLNDSRSLRRDGHKNDVYAVFARLVASGKIPNLYRDLKAVSQNSADNH